MRNKKYLLFLFVLNLSFSAYSEETVFFSFDAGSRYKIIEKYNYSKKINGVYQGHVYREIQGVFDRYSQDADYSWFKGKVFFYDETSREGLSLARKVSDIEDVNFGVSSRGAFRFKSDDRFYAGLHSFPAFSGEQLAPGDKWLDFSWRNTDPLNNGKTTKVRVYCEYQYTGRIVYSGLEYHRIKAKYAVRYKPGEDRYGDPELSTISGTHDVFINIPVEGSGYSMFATDTFYEDYTYKNGKTVNLKGSILFWYGDAVRMEKGEIIKDIQKVLDTAAVKDVVIEERPEGIALSLQNIHFVADKAEILPDEKPRLDALYKALAAIPGRTFLVTGHTADVGSKESQYALSVERARLIAAELQKRGIAPDRLIFAGRGGDEPVSPNDSEENRAKNRRVELIILEN